MRAQRAQGRPGTAVIPEDWNSSHGAVVAKTMPACVNLRRPGSTKTFDGTKTVIAPLAPYALEQGARIQAQSGRAVDRSEVAAEETLVVTGYLVTLAYDRPLSHEPLVGDLIDIVTVDDRRLIGATLRITDVVTGTHRFERDVLCTLTRPAATE